MPFPSRASLLGVLALIVLSAPGLSAQGGPRPRPGGDGPAVGDRAPLFKARALGKKEDLELEKLLAKEKKPVVLIFGSFT